MALKQGSSDEQVYRQKESVRLKSLYNSLQMRLDRAYEDRLDGVIDEEYWIEVSTKWRTEQDITKDRMNGLESAGRSYVDRNIEIVELAQQAHFLYLTQDAHEKRQLIKALLSNCTLDDRTLYPTYTKSFNYIAEGIQMQSKLPRIDEFCNFCSTDEGRLIADQLAMVQGINN